jgi:hypothetical protein
MIAPFYIADASVATSTNVKTSSAAGAPDLILPAGAVVSQIAINDGGTGSIDIGTRGFTSGTVTAAAIASNLTVTVGTTGIGSVVTGTAIAAMSYVTAVIDTSGAGTVGGYITYFVPTNGQYA